jgi:UDP-N-acetyl-D-glucosamine dehydrogenase
VKFERSSQLSAAFQLYTRISEKRAKVGVLGLGYVGLPLAIEFAKAGFDVTGIDVNEERVRLLNQGKSYLIDSSAAEIGPLVKMGKLRATSDFSVISQLDTVDICVPTPLRKTKDPDMSYVVAATESIAERMHSGFLVMLGSTTYPGATNELLLPKFEETGLKVGVDFFLCFSPERVDPGNATYKTANIPKVVGGITPICMELGVLLYRQTLETVVPVSSTRVAEMVKLLENTFRLINIGMVNEFALMCDRMNINVWEVIDAAATKPFGFMPFYPGPGLGGHCIPIDPFYLSWKSKQAGIEARFIDLAGYVNGRMPEFVVEKIQNALNSECKSVRGSHIHILGVAYKRNVNDVRESPALDIILMLQRLGAHVTFSDPYVERVAMHDAMMEGQDMQASVRAADCVAIVTDHESVDYHFVFENSKLIVDTRNTLKNFQSDKITRL